MTIHVENAMVLIPEGGRVKTVVEWGVRWHDGLPGSTYATDGGERWYADEDKARYRATRFPRDEADDEFPMWGELIRREVVTVTGPTETVDQ